MAYKWVENTTKFFFKKNFHIFFTAGNTKELNYVNQIKGDSNSTIL